MPTDHAPLEVLASGFGLVEGPRVDAEGRLYFSDALKGGVYRRAANGEVETIVPKRRGVGGIALHEDGGIVISGRDISHVRDGTSRFVFALDDVPGFNDLFTDAQGSILVGTQRFDPFAEKPTGVPGEMYRITGAGQGEQLYDDVALTNGIGLSPNGRLLYHSDSQRGYVLVHDLGSDGRCTHRRVFAKLAKGAPDGLAVDEEGGVWVAAWGAGCVVRFTPDGAFQRQVDVPARNVASTCFGGADRRDLTIVTADNTDEPARGGTIFRTRVDEVGLAPALARV
jgi:D-xylonolactonase